MQFIGLMLALTACLVSASPAAGARGGPAQKTPVVRADLITDAHPLGWKVVAVAIEYRDADQRGCGRHPDHGVHGRGDRQQRDR